MCVFTISGYIMTASKLIYCITRTNNNHLAKNYTFNIKIHSLVKFSGGHV